LNERSTVERSSCIGCGKCAEVCPNEARRLVGRYMTVGEVMPQVLRDMKFYENSGGGITLSGGEPIAQPHFALSVLEKCKETGMHTTLDTCGYVSWPIMEKLLSYTDLVLYDVKHLDPSKHLEATGRDNRLILRNAVRIARLKPIRVRVPVIPGFNDSLEEIRGIARFAKKELGSPDIDLLEYNKLGEGKYKLLERNYYALQPKSDRHIQAMESIVSLEVGVPRQDVA
jgi:pyruvate formate lyase activating enzyme